MVIELIVIYHRYFAKMGGNARMAMLTHEERIALGRKPVRPKSPHLFVVTPTLLQENLTLTDAEGALCSKRVNNSRKPAH